MEFLKKVFDFVARPTHSRTLGLVVMLVLVAAISLTVYVAQQPQQLKQQAAGEPCGDQQTCGQGEHCVTNDNEPPFCTTGITPSPTPTLPPPTRTPTPIVPTFTPTPTLTPTSAPAPKKNLGETCTQTNECKTGLICGNFDEIEKGSGICAFPPTSIPTPTKIPCSLNIVKGNFGCFRELYDKWKINIKAGTSNINYFNTLKNKYLGR